MRDCTALASSNGMTISELRFVHTVLFNKDVRPHAALSNAEQSRFDEVLARYGQGVPLGYILGEEAFYGLRFFVDERVLIPRPETELLVEASLSWIAGKKGTPVRVLDLCSGSGVVGISIATHCAKGSRVSLFFSDISEDTFPVLRRNAAYHRIDEYRVVRSDALSAFASGSFDLVVCNPPYVEDAFLANNTALSHEPLVALRGGPDGAAVCRKILVQARSRLRAGGRLLMEISEKNSDDLLSFATRLFGEGACRIDVDYAGKDRILSVEAS